MLDRGVCLVAGWESPVPVGVVVIQVLRYSIRDGPRNLCSTGAVEVRHGVPFVVTLKGWEMLSYLFRRNNRASHRSTPVSEVVVT